MGSSKKHKEKDREHKHKRKHRSRDRSRSKERKHRDKASRGSKSDGSKRAKYDQDYVAQGDLNMPYSIRVDAAPVVDESLDTAGIQYLYNAISECYTCVWSPVMWFTDLNSGYFGACELMVFLDLLLCLLTFLPEWCGGLVCF